MSTSPVSKRIKISPPLIGTHNGHFHADEALAVYLLRLLPPSNPSTLLRTRDPALLSTCHTVVDVGGEYDPSTNRYDHHQRTFNTTFPNRSTKLSSAGLVYMHFGKSIIAHHTGLDPAAEETSLLYRKLYTEFIEAIDANDNGISVYSPSETANLTKRFNDSGITLSSLVSDLNNDFSISAPPNEGTETATTDGVSSSTSQADEDSRFLAASELMGKSFLRKLTAYHSQWLPARSTVLAA
ncbi:MAG: hypothetical protein Q9211_001309, partial [Gyalolechia sp. 1 TL-2023]